MRHPGPGPVYGTPSYRVWIDCRFIVSDHGLVLRHLPMYIARLFWAIVRGRYRGKRKLHNAKRRLARWCLLIQRAELAELARAWGTCE